MARERGLASGQTREWIQHLSLSTCTLSSDRRTALGAGALASGASIAPLVRDSPSGAGARGRSLLVLRVQYGRAVKEREAVDP